jgi:hypothetical protein
MIEFYLFGIAVCFLMCLYYAKKIDMYTLIGISFLSAFSWSLIVAVIILSIFERKRNDK